MSERIPEKTLSPDGKFLWSGAGWEPVGSSSDGVPPAPPAPLVAPSPESRLRRRRSWLIVGVVVGVLAIGSVVAELNSGSSSLAVVGSLTLTGGGGYTTESPCYGTANSLVDYSDLQPTTQVEVLDASGAIDGTTELGSGTYSPDNQTLDAESGGHGPYDSCEFKIRLTLDHSSPHYQLVVGERPPFAFDDPKSLRLTLGFSHM